MFKKYYTPLLIFNFQRFFFEFVVLLSSLDCESRFKIFRSTILNSDDMITVTSYLFRLSFRAFFKVFGLSEKKQSKNQERSRTKKNNNKNSMRWDRLRILIDKSCCCVYCILLKSPLYRPKMITKLKTSKGKFIQIS